MSLRRTLAKLSVFFRGEATCSKSGVLRMILLHGLRLTLGGIALGLLLSLALSRSITSLLFGTSPFDPLVSAAVGTLLAAIATIAYLIPAHRATVIDPTQALRAD